ncbi:hypothetical protein BST29_00500 [Mycobacterium malmoense]|uniref:Apea-like HEPN domain-containing protein n=1 Tax=Mycobacterium malmoense TaxID=1780 RepID=A0ABX3SYU2_MYCMA|nr:hypothetical protein BMG05_22395 [Mycobacterium malmoense]ORA85389.1 hypothetical protein BST29_00500 [Mycobacterium malmoense]
MGLGGLIRESVKQNALTEDEAHATRYLVEVRNEAIHQGVASEGQAEEFAELTLRFAAAARFESGQFGVEGVDPL